jgi:hypothetical protein
MNPQIENINTNIRIIKGRPKLESLIPNVIYGIESKEGLPEKYTEKSKEEMRTLLINKIIEFNEDDDVKATEKIEKIRQFGNELGFSLDDLLSEIGDNPASDDIMEQFSEYDPQSSSAESDAKNLIKHLSLSKVIEPTHQRSMRFKKPPVRKNSDLVWSDVGNAMNKRHSNEILKPSFCPRIPNDSQEKFTRKLGRNIMSTWGIMYCGGSKSMIECVKDISVDYNIDLHLDSFAW